MVQYIPFGAVISSADETTLGISAGIISLKNSTTYEKVLATSTATGACAVLSITGLNLNTYKKYRLVGSILTTATAGDVGLNLAFNTDYTASHYIDQQIAGKDAGAVSNTGTQANQGQLVRTYANAASCYFDIALAVDVSGYAYGIGHTYSVSATGPVVNFMMVIVKKTDATTNATSVQIWTSDGANKIDTGSWIRVVGCS